MNLKQYREKALPLIAQCLGLRFEHEARENHRGERGSDELEVVVQWAGPKLVGICGLGTEDKSAKAVWLGYFAVHPDYRGQGIGGKLLAATEERARQQGYQWMNIETYMLADFWAARQLCSHAGYRLVANEGGTLTYRKRLI